MHNYLTFSYLEIRSIDICREFHLKCRARNVFFFSMYFRSKHYLFLNPFGKCRSSDSPQLSLFMVISLKNLQRFLIEPPLLQRSNNQLLLLSTLSSDVGCATPTVTFFVRRSILLLFNLS